METDTEYLRAIAENENLPGLMREQLRMAAYEIERLRDFSGAWEVAPIVEVKQVGTDENGICRLIAYTTPEELQKGLSLAYKRVAIGLRLE
jgi:hypothetical protein